MMSLTRRQMVLLAIALLALVSLTLILAPTQGQPQQYGSTYSRAPQGYGAWYAFMQERGTPLQRWQKPLAVLLEPDGEAAKALPSAEQAGVPSQPITLIQIADDALPLDVNHPWIGRGNVLIVLGVRSPVTDAPFTTDLPSQAGSLRIQTRRRYPLAKLNNKDSARLSDRFGAVVWQAKSGNGRIIYVATPYLAANAYQDIRPNYEFLAQLATEPGLSIWVDEYLHGHRDATATATATTAENLWSYLLNTPLSLLGMQAIVLLLLLLWGQHRRFGPPLTVADPPVDNSAAYIQAMAAVLQKANCSDFVLETISKAERITIQKQLGLGPTPLDPAVVLAAWQQQTGQPLNDLKTDLKTVLQPPSRSSRRADAAVRQWTETVQRVRQQLPNESTRLK